MGMGLGTVERGGTIGAIIDLILLLISQLDMPPWKNPVNYQPDFMKIRDHPSCLVAGCMWEGYY